MIGRLWNSPSAMTVFNTACRYGGLALLMAMAGRYLPPPELAFFYLFSGIFSSTFIFVQGLVPTVARYLAQRNTATRSVKIGDRLFKDTDLIVTASRLHLRIALILAVLMGTLGSWAMTNVVDLSGDRTSGWLAWGLMVITAPVSVYATQYIAILQGANLVAVEQRWSAIVTGLGYFVGAALLVISHNMLTLIATLQIAQLVNALRLKLLTSKLKIFADPSTPKGAYHPEIFERLWPDIRKMTLGGLLTVGVTNLSGFVLTNRLAPLDLASTLMATRLMLMIVEITRAPFYSQIPIFNMLRASGDLKKLAALSSQRMRLSLWSFLLMAAVVGTIGNLFLHIIGSSVELPKLGPWLAFTTVFLFDRSASMHNQIYLTTHHVIWHWFAAGQACVAILLMMVLPAQLGLLLFPLSLGSGLLLIVWIPAVVLSVHSLKQSVWRFERTVLLPPLFSLLFICAFSAFL